MAILKAVIIFLSFILTVCSLNAPSMLDALGALERVISYYKSNYKIVNLDGVFGLKIVEGHLISILEDHARGIAPHLSPEVVTRIKKMRVETEDASLRAIPFIKKLDPEYFKQLHYVIEHPWNAWKTYRKLDSSLKWKRDVLDNIVRDIDEETSDRCMAELITGPKKACPLSSSCLAIMIGVRGLKNYAITHQLLYTQLAEQVGCGPRLNLWLDEHNRPGGTHRLQLEFCSNIHTRMSENLMGTNGVVLPVYQDLLMEEVFVCASLGFRDLLEMPLLQQMVMWQQPSGCYGTMPKPNLPNIRHDPDYDYRDDEDLNMQQKMADVYQQSPIKKRDLHLKQKISETKQQTQKISNLQQKHDSPYEMFKLAHAPVVKKSNSVTQTPAAVILNKNNVKIVDNQLVHQTDSPNKNMQQTPNFPPGNQRGQLQKPPPPKPDTVKTVLKNSSTRITNTVSEAKTPKVTSTAAVVKNGVASNFRVQGTRGVGEHGGEMVKRSGPASLTKEEDFQVGGGIVNFRKRRLLMEKELPDGCLSHKTSVAAGALVVYLHHLTIGFATAAPSSVTSQDRENSLITKNTQKDNRLPKHHREIMRGPAKGGAKRIPREKSPGNLSLHKVIVQSVSKRTVDSNGDKDPPPRRGDQELGQDYAEENDDYQGYANQADDSKDVYNHDEKRKAKLFVGQKAVIKKTGNGDKENYDEEQYDRYYYEGDEDESKKHNSDKNKDILIVENAKQDQGLKHGDARPHKVIDPFYNQNSIPTTHLIIFSLITLALLYFMYRFIRKRRVLIRYPFIGRS